ncbi:hypothetical protein LCGC14_2924650, partial [marine sediment metagenome]
GDDTTAAHPSDKDLDVDNFQGAGQTLTQKWEGSTDGEQNTFADARSFAIITHIYDSANATAVIARMTSLVIAEEAAISKMVTLSGGNWDLRDDFIHYGMQTEANALTGWKLKTHIAVNAPTHTPGTGFTFNGTTQYINSQFVPSVDGVNHTLNDCMFAIYNKTNNGTAVTRHICGGRGAGRLELQQQASVAINYRMNSAGLDLTNLESDFQDESLYTCIRTASNVTALYVSDVKLNSGTHVSSSLSSLAQYIAAVNTGSPAAHYAGVISSYGIGAAIGFDIDLDNTRLKVLNIDLAAI